MPPIGIKDLIDILIVAVLLYYIYRLMKQSGSITIFYGITAFIALWIFASQIFEMRLIGLILDQFMGVGLIIVVILFQDPIRRFLAEVGSRRKIRYIKKLFRHHGDDENDKQLEWVMPVVYACMNMSKSKTGALIVVEQAIPLDSYENTGDYIDADINSRLIENIFFKNSPLHDGALIIAKGRIKSVGCILPVSHDSDLPRYLGLRHRSALGIAQATDAIAIVVSEETGKISLAHLGQLTTRLSSADLERRLVDLASNSRN